MENKELRTLLNQLHEEIKNTQEVDEKGSKLLLKLEADIHLLLERSEEDREPLHPSIFQNLENTVTHFEVTHPNLTELVSEVSEALSNAGI